MKRSIAIVVGILMLLTVNKSLGQQDSRYTQYMYNTIVVNPAYAGNRGMLSMFAMYRNQWMGLEGAPKTLMFSINSPVKTKGVGLGLDISSDQIGPSSKTILAGDFSYTIRLNTETKLSFGVKGGVNFLNIDVGKLHAYDPADINLVNTSLASPVIGSGFYLHQRKWYLGISSPNLLETEHYDDVLVSTATEISHFYLIGGYVFDLNKDFKLKPAVLAKAVSGAPLALDISANLMMYEKIITGLSYRLNTSVNLTLGFQVSDILMIGYAYDYETTELRQYNSGSHEVFLRFELGTQTRNKVNPRFF